MARTPAYWTNKKYWPSMQVVSQLSLSQAPHGFGAPYRGFPAFLSPSNCVKTAKLRRLQVTSPNIQVVSGVSKTRGPGSGSGSLFLHTFF